MANGSRSASSSRKRSRYSRGRSGCHNQIPSGRSKSGSSSSCNCYNSSARGYEILYTRTVWQWHPSSSDGCRHEDLEGKLMCKYDANHNEPWSPHQCPCILNGCSSSFSLNNEEGAVSHPAQHLHPTLNISRYKHLVLHLATSDRLLAVVEITTLEFNSD